MILMGPIQFEYDSEGSNTVSIDYWLGSSLADKTVAMKREKCEDMQQNEVK